MVRCRPSKAAYGVRFQARGHEGRADTLKAGVGGDSGMRPHEILEAALATCMTITARMAAAEVGADADGTRVVVDLERAEEACTFRYELHLPTGLSHAQAEAISSRVDNCPVRRTLSKEARFDGELVVASGPAEQ